MAERYDGPLRNRIGDGELVDYAGRVVGMYYVDSIDSPTPPQDATDAGDGVNPASRPAEPFDPERFCSRCFAGVDSDEHHAKCVATGYADDGQSAPNGAPTGAQKRGPAEPSLVALDEQIHAAERIVLARAHDLIGALDLEAIRQAPDFWTSLGLLSMAVSELERAEAAR